MLMRIAFTIFYSLVLGSLSMQSCSVDVQHQNPNFIFILVDDLGITDLSCYGSKFYESPNLDKLAKTSVRFTNAYASSPVCSPTRASIMTGQHPVRLNITDWIPGLDPKDKKLLGPEDNHQLPLNEKTVAEILKDYGYKTFFTGKWHLGGENFFPENQGFDINKGGYHAGMPSSYYVPYNNPKLEDGPEGEYLPDRLTTESIDFIQKNRDKPFFVYLSFYTVHKPIEPCNRHLNKFQKKSDSLALSEPSFRKEHDGITKLHQDNPEYASMVYAMDENVGRLLQTINEQGIEDNTVIIFTSDNGGLSTLFHEGSPTSNEPFRAGKGWCYEGGIRVPLIIHVPWLTEKTVECNVPVTSMDFYPTILDLANIPQVPDQHADGLSLLPLLQGKNNLDRDTLYWHFPHYHGSAWTPGSAMRLGDWKLIEFYHEAKVELYNLKEYIGEQHELSKKYPEKVSELKNVLHRWQKKMGAKFPIPNPNYKE
jgi:arylsulfatase A-like enzyme